MLQAYIDRAEMIARKGKLRKPSEDEISLIVNKLIWADIESENQGKYVVNNFRYKASIYALSRCHADRWRIRRQFANKLRSKPSCRLHLLKDSRNDESPYNYGEIVRTLCSLVGKRNVKFRDIKMFIRRIARNETLEAISVRYGCTRENVRQRVEVIAEMMRLALERIERKSEKGLIEDAETAKMICGGASHANHSG